MTRKLATIILLGLAVLIVGFLSLTYVEYRALAQEAPAAGPNSIPEINRVQMDSAHFGLNWNVAGTGGGDIGSGHFKISSTLGQPVIGKSNSTHFSQRAGFWAYLLAKFRIYLPVLFRSS